MPTATSKAVQVTYLPVVDHATMADALSSALDVGFRGTITTYRDASDTQVWMLEINGDTLASPVHAKFGDVLVWDTHNLRAMPQAEFDNNYDA